MLTILSNAVYGRKRGPPVGSGRDKKRKAAEDYSQNPHTKKARARKENMNPLEKELETAKARERQQLSRKIKSLQKKEEYKALSPEDQKLYVHEVTAGMKEIQYEAFLTSVLSTNYC
jgi:hypothetical protein